MEKEPTGETFLSRIRNKASKIGKIAILGAALNAGEAMAQEPEDDGSLMHAWAERAQTERRREREKDPAKTKVVDENLDVFIVETAEPFVEEVERLDAMLDHRGLTSDEYALGREKVVSQKEGIDKEIEEIEHEMAYVEGILKASLRFATVIVDQMSPETSEKLSPVYEKLVKIENRFSSKALRLGERHDELLKLKKDEVRHKLEKEMDALQVEFEKKK